MEHARGDEPSRDNAREKSAHRGVGDREGQVRTRLGTACRVVLPSLLLVIALRVLLVGVYVIPTGSMVPTIMPGDFIPGEKASVRAGAPAIGDVVTFESPEEACTTLVKRVVATEGQVVDLRDGMLFVDGMRLWEPYAEGSTLPASDSAVDYPHMVAEGCVWVMGDNREASRDSRFFGDVPTSSVSSRAVWVYWPPEDAGAVR